MEENVKYEVEVTPAPGVLDALARLPEKAVLDENGMAAAFKVSTRTIRRMVGRYEIPPGVRLAGHTVWMAGKVLAFLEEKMEQAQESARGRAGAFSRNKP